MTAVTTAATTTATTTTILPTREICCLRKFTVVRMEMEAVDDEEERREVEETGWERCTSNHTSINNWNLVRNDPFNLLTKTLKRNLLSYLLFFPFLLKKKKEENISLPANI